MMGRQAQALLANMNLHNPCLTELVPALSFSDALPPADDATIHAYRRNLLVARGVDVTENLREYGAQLLRIDSAVGSPVDDGVHVCQEGTG